MVRICAFLLESAGTRNSTINVATPISLPVQTIVGLFEEVLGKKAVCRIVDGGASYSIETGGTQEAAEQLGIKFDEDYLARVIRKYYG